MGKFGTSGTDPGQLNNPISVAVDLYGFILVAADIDNCVSIFDKDGSYINCFGSDSYWSISISLWNNCQC